MSTGINTDNTLRQVVRHIHLSEQADLLVATGDLAHDPVPAVYQRFTEILSDLEVPIVTLPGNHDESRLMATAFRTPALSFLGERRKENWHLLFLDTSWQGEVSGRLSASELDRLKRYIETSDAEHLFLFLHHHPVPVGSRWMDAIALENLDDFWSLVSKDSRVRGVACGHVHQELDVMHNAVRVLASPATCVQFMPGLDTSAIDSLPPAYRVIDLAADGTIDTRIEWMPRSSIGG